MSSSRAKGLTGSRSFEKKVWCYLQVSICLRIKACRPLKRDKFFSSRNVGNHPKTRRSIPEERRPWFLFQTLWPQYRLRGTAHPAAIWSKIWKRGMEKSDESRTRRDWAKGENILKWIKGQRISWLGHLERMEKNRVPEKELHSRTGRDENKGKTQENISYTIYTHICCVLMATFAVSLL